MIYERGNQWWGRHGGERFSLDVPTGPDAKAMKKLATERLAQIIIQKKNGTYFQTMQEHKRSLRELFESYMEAEGKDLKAGSNYYKIGKDGEVKGYARRLYDRLGADTKLNLIDSGKIIDYKTLRASEGLSACGINQELRFLRQAWNYGIRRKWCKKDSNPITEARLVKGEKPRKRFLQDGELPRLVAAIGPAKWPRYALLLLTGIRRSELVRLRWSDIDLTARTLTVAESKTQDGVRTMPLEDPAVALLKKLPLSPETDLVFFNRYNRPLDARKLTRIFTQAVRDAGLPNLHLHDMRRSYATLMLRAGVQLDTVSKLLGHSDTTITERVYAKHSVESLRADIDRARKPGTVSAQSVSGNA